MHRTTLTIEGMHCGHCVTAVTNALTELDSVQIERIAIGTAVVEHDPEHVSTDDLVSAVEDAGYTASVEG